MQTLIQDLRYGARMLWKKPGFTIVAIVTLALGIGANTTIFSFVNGILLRSLPYPQPDRLVVLDETALKRGVTSMGVSYPNFLDWREQNRVFEDIAAYQGSSLALTGAGGEPEQIRGAEVSHGLFEILRVSPLMGRTITEEEDRPKNDDVVLIGYGLWQRRFGGDPELLGQKILLNARPYTVIGIMPEGFRFPDIADYWVPLALTTQIYTRTDHGLSAIARLKDGVNIQQAAAEMTDIAGRIEQQNPVTNEGLSVSVASLYDALTGDYHRALMILLSVVGCVLLIACANVANLMLVRATTRQREMAIRAALGAGRGRIVRQLLTESLLLSLIGGGLGLLLAVWGLDLLLAAIPIKLPFWMKFGIDLRVLGFTLGISLLTGLVFGVLPALHASKTNLNETLKEGGRGVGSSRQRSRSLFVVAEIALSLVLLVGAGLMMRSFLKLQHVNSGLNPAGVMTLRISLPRLKYPEAPQRSNYYRQLMERLRAQPGVEGAAAITTLPLSGGGWGRSLTVEDYPVLSVGQAPFIQHNVVTPGYFATLGIPLLEGRDFTDADTADGPKITIVDERLARQYWPNESPLGKRIRFGPPEDNEPWHTIVGVVGAVRHERLDAETRMSVYLPHAEISVGGMFIVVRGSAKPESLIAPVRQQIHELDPTLPLTYVRTMDEVIAQSVWQPRLYTILFGVFAAVALLLAAVGLYGVMAYSVTVRTHEIGLRMALGAQTGAVLRLVASQAIKLVMVGVTLGLVAALLLTRLMAGLLFATSTSDPLTFTGIAVLLMLVALVACYLPARRATKVDPMVALRYE